MSQYELWYSTSHRGFAAFKDITGQITYVKALSGLVEFVDTVNDKGHLIVNTDVDFESTYTENKENYAAVAYLSICGCQGVTIPEGAKQISVNNAPDFWRMCYRRSNSDWRLRNEHVSSKIVYVPTYKGVGRLDWFDRTSHFYHWGTAWEAPNGDAYLLPAPASIQPQRPDHVNQAMRRHHDSIFVAKELVTA